VLKGLDARVDGMINAASGLYASNAIALQAAVEHSEKGLAAAAAAKDAYLQRIESALGLLKVLSGSGTSCGTSCTTDRSDMAVGCGSCCCGRLCGTALMLNS
jgi:hypothetical protein